ncbi:thymidylate synthase, partial [Vibrio parahaemolyticus]|uniref:thymidylate synthase n=1 Tax=Vibrio parahaemolyticus TaxID=670 RepID=UPI002112F4A3
MAKITGKNQVKSFHKIVNAHIYEDHLELLRDVQLKSETLQAPTFNINPDIKYLEYLENFVTQYDYW